MLLLNRLSRYINVMRLRAFGQRARSIRASVGDGAVHRLIKWCARVGIVCFSVVCLGCADGSADKIKPRELVFNFARRALSKIVRTIPLSEPVFDSSLAVETLIAPDSSLRAAFGIALLPADNQILITERACRNLVVFKDGAIAKKIPIAIPNRHISVAGAHINEPIFSEILRLSEECMRSQDDSVAVRNTGLLGIAVDPDYRANNFIYLGITLHNTNNGSDTAYSNHAVLRVTYNPATMTVAPITEEDILVEDTMRPLTGLNRSPGGRLLFLPDGTLLFTVGYAHTYTVSQSMDSFGGKTVRMFPDGRPVCGDALGTVAPNPFCGDPFDSANPEPHDYIYTFGHKNNQGLIMVHDLVFASEHGESGGDEINIITSGDNYGFPYFCSGGCISYLERQPFGNANNASPGTLSSQNINNYIRPATVWNTRGNSIAPSGIAFYPFRGTYKDNLLVTSLRAKTLFRFSVDDNYNLKLQSPVAWRVRFRDVVVANDGDIYVLANNVRDGDTAGRSALYKIRLPSP